MFLKLVIFKALCLFALQLKLLSAQLEESPNSPQQPGTSYVGPQQNSFTNPASANIFPGKSANDFGGSTTNVNTAIFPSFNNFPSQVFPNALTTAFSHFGVPNAFATASLAIPSIQRYLTHRIPGYQAAELIFKVADKRSAENGYPNHATIANLVAQNIAGIDFFSMPLYFQVRGNVIEKFLVAEGIELTPDLPPRYADALETALSSRVIDSPETLHRLVLDGYTNFLQSLGGIATGRSYILSLYVNKEFARFRNV